MPLTGFLVIRDDLCHGVFVLQMAQYSSFPLHGTIRDPAVSCLLSLSHLEC